MRPTPVRQAQDVFLTLGAAAVTVVVLATIFLRESAIVLEAVYPAGALFVGVILYRHYPVTYVGFTWWIVFLTPHVRRLVDYQSGWSQISPVMITPYLVAGLSVLALLRSPGLLRRREFLPFALALAGIAFGYLVGLVRSGPAAATFDLLEWAIPVLFGLHTALVWPAFPSLGRTLRKAFVWGILVMGVYGVFQFLWPPEWDRYWMLHSGMNTIGRPEPLEVRVFSTLNSPGPFGMIMMAGTLILFSERGAVRGVAAVPAYLSFLLSLVRSAWGGWFVGALFLVSRVRKGLRARLAVGLVALVAVVVTLTVTVPAFDSAISARVGTLGSLEEDRSLQSRLAFLTEIRRLAFVNPVGTGLGSTGRAAKLETGDTVSFDNGIANIPYVLGWPGAFLFGAAALLLLAEIRRSRPLRRDGFVTAAESVGLAMAVQILFVNTLISTVGLLFWCFLGVSLAHRLWSCDQVQQLSSRYADTSHEIKEASR